LSIILHCQDVYHFAVTCTTKAFFAGNNGAVFLSELDAPGARSVVFPAQPTLSTLLLFIPK
jgi:hypothetical protein